MMVKALRLRCSRKHSKSEGLVGVVGGIQSILVFILLPGARGQR